MTWWQVRPTGNDVLIVSRRGTKQPGRPAMDTIGLDLHKRESQLCIMSALHHRRGRLDQRAPHRHKSRAIYCGTGPLPTGTNSSRGLDRERVGRTAPREPGSRGRRRRSELRTDVGITHASGEDRQARCSRSRRCTETRSVSSFHASSSGARKRP